MTTIVLIIHILIAIGLIGMVLIQRSEGGALGIGGGGGGGGLMSSRGAANALTRTTSILAAAFFATSITLTLLAKGDRDASIIDRLQDAGAPDTSAPLDDGLTPNLAAPVDADAPAEQNVVIPDVGPAAPNDDSDDEDPPQ